jgi:hypothetical protein
VPEQHGSPDAQDSPWRLQQNLPATELTTV